MAARRGTAACACGRDVVGGVCELVCRSLARSACVVEVALLSQQKVRALTATPCIVRKGARNSPLVQSKSYQSFKKTRLLILIIICRLHELVNSIK